MSAASTSRQNLHFLTLLSLFCLAVSASDELQTLLSIKTSLQSPTADVFNSWKPTNRLCSFTGIACNPDGSVNSIDLSNQKLTGSVPFDSICQLPSLETLAVGKNSFSGPISEDVKNCVRLKYLDIGNNFFSGTVPDLSSLSRLEYLYLNSSGFSGKFPWNSISNMTGLVVLSVGDNRFDRTLFPNVVVSLTKLNWLYLANCSIEGKIPPEIGNLTELVNLELSDNYMSGEIPPEISKLSKLWQLELYGNGLTGNFPVGFGNLTSLEKFDASRNYLEGDLSELRTLNKLVSLQLYKNEFSGEVPEELGHFEKLVNLSLYENKLTGSLPERLGSVSDFNFIDASENFLTGRIPPEMCKQGKMTKLLLIRNKLSGEIPSTYANCMSMTRFRITSDIGNAKSLTQIFVNNNQLSGELPPEISKATGLIAIDLSDNQFSGNIPETIGELRLLNRLHLQNNMFSGPIPDTIGNCVAFNDINMAHNSLSGEIPVSIGSLPVLNSLNLSENTLSGQIPVTLSSLRLSLLDLSNNRLTGPIPQSLSQEAYEGSFAGNNRLCSQNIKSFPRCSPGSGSSKELRLVILCVALGAIVLLLSVLCMLLFSKKSQKDEERSLKEDSWDVKSFHVLSFTEDEIIDSIKEDNLIGKGGSGNVYRVVLSNGKELAVKHIWNSDSGDRKKSQNTTPMLKIRAGKSREFDAEVQTLSSIRHVNVVKLYCSITSEDSSLLVYEYLPNGSLWDRLHTCRKMGLDWETRYEIAVGAAKGLEYLHHGSKIVQANTSKDSTHVIAGTHGYIAPEYGYTYKVNEKSDVYSFGVVLMELVTGKRPIEPEYGENRDIVNWASNNLKSKESVLGMVDSTIQEAYKEEAIKVLRIAILCTARLPALRPTMRSVVQMLEEADPCRYVGIIVRKNGASEKEEVKDYDKA
ncbi:leucine-rich receptor-like protein kinase family protein [Actinidia rufa]|uniref:non-specific serine/threonine protein kinase n=1 Tax=Actinidia rufa TaxID=165716 RepID=A0A7J0EHH7_9ERIC|nr:leucine-rich receptor-like protein kinase family protein [Actinidia rufa]